MIKGVVVIILSYLFGSIPFGVLISKYKGIDIQKSGSGNIGATNVLRTLGRLPALITLFGDLLKGTFTILLAKGLLEEPWIALSGMAVILGHIFPISLRFKGGKGVATAIGVFLVYSPIVFISSVLIWSIVVYIFRYSSLGAIVTFLSLPVIISIMDPDKVKIIFSSLISLIILYRHRENIGRLLKGTETKIGERT